MTRLLLLIPFLSGAFALKAAPVSVAGDDPAFIRHLSSSLPVRNITKSSDIDISKSRTLIVFGGKSLPAAYRQPIDRFLQAGGNLIVAGNKALQYEPLFTTTHPLFPFDTLPPIVRPKRSKPSGSVDTPAVTRIEHEGKNGIAFTTTRRGMRDMMFEIPLGKMPEGDNMFIFRARGSHFMDLLPIEITDKTGKIWYSFVPLDTLWHEYAVSMADFLPENWNDPDKPYPLLEPSQAVSLRMGMNTMAIWREKPMGFAVSDLHSARSISEYTPSSRLKQLRLPFEQIGISAPGWIIDPFLYGKTVSDIKCRKKGEYFPLKISTIDVAQGTIIPPLYYEHPGSAMGSDHKKSVRDKQTRMMRTVTFLADQQGRSLGEFIQYGRGRYAGGSVILIGLDSHVPEVAKIIPPIIHKIENTPRIAGFSITTTNIQTEGYVHPVILTEIVNPLHKEIDATLSVNFGNSLQNKIHVKLHSRECRQYRIELPEVPHDFPMERFDWQITCSTAQGCDTVSDTADTERALITALRHLVHTQRLYPDGRISNHYFGDAYGVRAMFAYTALLAQDPDRMKRNADLWATVSPEEIRHCGERFYGMLIDRQLPSGAWPMGYSEHSQVYNVADCGQMAISIGQSIRYVTSSSLRNRYLSSIQKFGRWAETYYIDSTRSEQLRLDKPAEFAKGNARPGFYGLGPAGRQDRLTGPSWVLSDILGAQILLARLSEGPEKREFRHIVNRNADFYARNRFSAASYYQAEALCWIYLDTDSKELKNMCQDNLKETFLGGLYQGKELDMYDKGSRATLKALPLLYYMRLFGDDGAMRAVLLKYIWSFASPSYVNSMDNLSKNMPRPVHGESIGAAKYAALSAIWAIELLKPGSTLIDFEKP